MSVDHRRWVVCSATWGRDGNVLARLSETFDPRQQNCVRHGVDIEELQAYSSLCSPPDRREGIYFLFFPRKR